MAGTAHLHPQPFDPLLFDSDVVGRAPPAPAAGPPHNTPTRSAKVLAPPAPAPYRQPQAHPELGATVIRWYAIAEPQQHLLPAVGVRVFGTSLPGSENRTNSKPATREAPTSA
jgi:hypothetical protein